MPYKGTAALSRRPTEIAGKWQRCPDKPVWLTTPALVWISDKRRHLMGGRIGE